MSVQTKYFVETTGALVSDVLRLRMIYTYYIGRILMLVGDICADIGFFVCVVEGI